MSGEAINLLENNAFFFFLSKALLVDLGSKSGLSAEMSLMQWVTQVLLCWAATREF